MVCYSNIRGKVGRGLLQCMKRVLTVGIAWETTILGKTARELCNWKQMRPNGMLTTRKEGRKAVRGGGFSMSGHEESERCLDFTLNKMEEFASVEAHKFQAHMQNLPRSFTELGEYLKANHSASIKWGYKICAVIIKDKEFQQSSVSGREGEHALSYIDSNCLITWY